MAVSADQITYVEELFEPLGPVTHRKMMGGATFYFDGQVFAILSSSGEVFLKAKGAFAEKMAAAGSRIFGMDGKTMGYWTLPDEAQDDATCASDWAREALSHL